MFFKVPILENFVEFTGKYLWLNLFLIKLQASGLKLFWKRDTNTSAVNIARKKIPDRKKTWEAFYKCLFYTEHLQANESDFNLKLNFFDGYSSRILMERLETTLWK